MNLVAGTYGPGSEDRMARLSSAIEEAYGERPIVQPDASSHIVSLDDGGIVLGRALNAHASLVLLGGLHHPLPGWEKKARPGDSPDLAAAWLLDRFCTLGEEFLDGVTGQLAVLVDDHTNSRFLTASDASGLRTLFVRDGDQGPSVASNLFVLARALRDRIEPDRSLEDFFLVYGYLPWGRTVFTGIRTLPPGELHIWDDGELQTRKIENGTVQHDRFHPLDPAVADEEEVVEHLYEAFMAATEEQTASAGRVAVLLGGVDSALVASALHRLGKEVETFSFHYSEPGFDQPHTDTLSEFLGIRHNWVQITPEIMRDGLERYGLVFSRPTNWPNYVIQTAHVCKVIRDRGILHVFSGDGCDHTFMGYPRTHRVARAYASTPRLPTSFTRLLVWAVARAKIELAIGRPYRVGMNVLRNLCRSMPERGFLSFRVFDESSLQRLRLEEPPVQLYDIETMLSKLTAGLEHLSPDRLAYKGKAGVSANKAKLGGSSDHTGSIIYAPYLHPGLKRLAESLPDSLLRPKGEPDTTKSGKYILLKMAERSGLLPRAVIYQEKVAAVDAPVDDWYAGTLRDTMRRQFSSLPFEADPAYLEHLLEPTRAARFYARKVSSDRITTHEASLLATYAGLIRALS